VATVATTKNASGQSAPQPRSIWFKIRLGSQSLLNQKVDRSTPETGRIRPQQELAPVGHNRTKLPTQNDMVS
jgi:hypothetical protein